VAAVPGAGVAAPVGTAPIGGPLLGAVAARGVTALALALAAVLAAGAGARDTVAAGDALLGAVATLEVTALAVALPAVLAMLAGVAWVTAAAAAEVTGCVTDVTVEVTAPSGEVSAWACREKASIRKKIPAAAIASCAARMATRRASGWGISGSHSPGHLTTHGCPGREPRNPGEPAFLPQRHPWQDMSFGHHRTTRADGRQGPS
jgi:hypothetical protein